MTLQGSKDSCWPLPKAGWQSSLCVSTRVLILTWKRKQLGAFNCLPALSPWTALHIHPCTQRAELNILPSLPSGGSTAVHLVTHAGGAHGLLDFALTYTCPPSDAFPSRARLSCPQDTVFTVLVQALRITLRKDTVASWLSPASRQPPVLLPTPTRVTTIHTAAPTASSEVHLL